MSVGPGTRMGRAWHSVIGSRQPWEQSTFSRGLVVPGVVAAVAGVVSVSSANCCCSAIDVCSWSDGFCLLGTGVGASGGTFCLLGTGLGASGGGSRGGCCSFWSSSTNGSSPSGGANVRTLKDGACPLEGGACLLEEDSCPLEEDSCPLTEGSCLLEGGACPLEEGSFRLKERSCPLKERIWSSKLRSCPPARRELSLLRDPLCFLPMHAPMASSSILLVLGLNAGTCIAVEGGQNVAKQVGEYGPCT